jgi:hypothetical protein
MPSTVLKSKNTEAMGTKRMLDPKPETVPTISAIKASPRNNQYFSKNIQFYHFEVKHILEAIAIKKNPLAQ